MDQKFTEIIDKYINETHLISGDTEKEIFGNFYNAVDKNPIEKWIKDTFKEKSIKDDKKSEIYRKDGNKYFKQNNYNLALQNYNNSLFCAPHSSKNFALALANRSAVFYAQEKYKSCVKDIRICFKYDYPDHLKYKLYVRLINCYFSVFKFEVAKKEVDVLRKYLAENISLTEAKKEQIFEEIKTMEYKSLKKLYCSENPQLNWQENDHIILPEFEENANFAYASNSISLQYDCVKGRYVTANSDIKMGDILFVEKSFSSVPILRHVSDNEYFCHHCFAPTDCPIPCKNCKTLFCSLECLKKSCEEYHQFECTGSCKDFWVNIGVNYLATRILILGVTSGYQNVFNVSQKQIDKFGDHCFNYDYVCSLVNNVEKIEKEVLFQYVMSALIVTTYLIEKTDFFEFLNEFLPNIDHEIVKNDPDVDILVGSVILKHALQVIANASRIESVEEVFYEKINSFDRTAEDPHFTIGVAMYPSYCMMNHSCKSNISTYFINDYVVVKAKTNIKKDSEIFNSYGHDCYIQKTAIRKEQLKKMHYFDCYCTGCTPPTLPERLEHGLLCQRCKGLSMPKENDFYECVSCKHIFNSKNHFVHVQKADELLEKYENTENIEYLKNCLRLREKILYKEHYSLYAAVFQMQDYYGNKGRFFEWAAHINRVQDLHIAIFGENSLRCAMNLRFQLLNLIGFFKRATSSEKCLIRKKDEKNISSILR